MVFSTIVSRFLFCVCFSVVSLLLSRLLLFNGFPFTITFFLFIGFPFTVTLFAWHWFSLSFYCHVFCFSLVVPFCVTLFAYQSLSSRFLLDIGFAFPFTVTLSAFDWFPLFVSRYLPFSPFPRASCLSLVFLFLLLSRVLFSLVFLIGFLFIGFPFRVTLMEHV